MKYRLKKDFYLPDGRYYSKETVLKLTEEGYFPIFPIYNETVELTENKFDKRFVENNLEWFELVEEENEQQEYMLTATWTKKKGSEKTVEMIPEFEPGLNADGGPLRIDNSDIMLQLNRITRLLNKLNSKDNEYYRITKR